MRLYYILEGLCEIFISATAPTCTTCERWVIGVKAGQIAVEAPRYH